MEGTVHVKRVGQPKFTLASQVMQRVKTREQERIRRNGTQSASWVRFDCRDRQRIPFVEED